MNDRLMNLLADLEGSAYAKMSATPAFSSFHDYANIVRKVDRATRQVEKAYRAVEKALDEVSKED